MTYVISQPCVDLKDKACVEECPVDCIYEGGRMLYIQPDECVDCGACEPVCPVEAIFYEDDVPAEWKDYTAANAEFFAELDRRKAVVFIHPTAPGCCGNLATGAPSTILEYPLALVAACALRPMTLDVVAGPYWYEGPDFKKRHEFYPAAPFDPLKYSDNFFAFAHDFNRDGWPDLFVGSDRVPAKLFRNDGKGRFVDEGVKAGVALSENGVARANMGTDAADVDGDGRPDLFVANIDFEPNNLFRNNGDETFDDITVQARLGSVAQLFSGFGTRFVDFDNDGNRKAYSR